MYCPFCQAHETKVVDSRLMGEGDKIRRRRQCIACDERFTTYELVELALPKVTKSDGVSEPFDEHKLRSGIEKALEKRPVSVESIDACIQRVVHAVRALGERSVSSKTIGQYVMDELKAMDDVAYVRFASVYRSFQDVSEFYDEIKQMLGAQKHDT